MKKNILIGTAVLGCCLAAVAQTGSTPNQTSPMSTPSTFPQDQTGQTPANPATPSNPAAIPPDTAAQTSDQSTPGKRLADRAGLLEPQFQRQLYVGG